MDAVKVDVLQGDLAVIFQELDIEIQRYRYKKAASAAMMV